MPDQSSNAFALLAERPCADRLPVAPVTDTFEFERFAPLTVVSEGQAQAAVIPTDMVAPYDLQIYHRNLREEVGLAELRGGVPLVKEWRRAPDLPPKPVVVDVGDPAAFIADPTARVGGRNAHLALSPGNVRALLAGEPSVVTVEDEHGRQRPVELNPTASASAAVDCLPAEPVELDVGAVRELVAGGTARVEALVGGERRPVYVRAADERTASSAHRVLSTAESDRTGDTVQLLGDKPGKIFQVEPPQLVLPTFEFALYLPYRQSWKLLGYSRGRLLNSIPLSPQEETTIEVFTWDRHTRSREDVMSSERESTLDVAFTSSDTAEVVGELTRRNDWSLDVGGRIGLPPIKGISISGNINNRTATQINAVNRRTQRHVDEATRKASSRIKTSRQTKVAETAEFGSETRVSRKIKNANMCRTLTYDFFEVSASYEVTTEPLADEIQLVVLAPHPLPLRIDRQFLIVHEGTLRTALLDPALAIGFESARALAARDEYCMRKCLDDCKCPEETKPQAPATPAGVSAGGGGAQPAATGGGTDPVELARQRVMNADKAVRDAIETLFNAGFRAVADAYDRKAPGSEKEDAIREYRQWLFREFGLALFSTGWWDSCVQYRSTQASPEALERLISQADTAWLESLIRGAFLTVVAQLAAPVLAAKLVIFLKEKVLWYAQFMGWHDAGLGAAVGQARTELKAWRDALAVQATGAAATGGQGAPTTGGGGAGEPTAKEETEEVGGQAAEPFPAEQVAMDVVNERALLAHVLENRSHYSRAIWQALDPADRRNMIGMLGSLSEWVDDDVLGFVGEKIALPFQSWRVGGLDDSLKKVLASVAGSVQPVTREVSVPTRGIEIQSRLGDCDACEDFIVKHRRHDLSLAHERVEQAKLETKRFEERLNQTPPLLEDPETDEGSSAIRVILTQDDAPER